MSTHSTLSTCLAIVVAGFVLFIIGSIERTGPSIPSTEAAAPFTSASDRPSSILDTKRCASQGNGKIACLERFVEKYGKRRTTKQMLTELNEATKTDKEMAAQCHPITHAIGRWTYAQTKDVSKAFDRCDQTCASGCYHGAVERVFFTEDQLAAGAEHADKERMQSVVKTLCDKSKFATHNDFGQCVHGAGHAILHGLDYDLWGALETCDYFNNREEQQYCYSGVYMENITTQEKEKRHLKLDDPLYPCNQITEDRYMENCVFYQPGYLLEIGYSPEKIIAVCRTSALPALCVRGLGKDLAYNTNNTKTMLAKICEGAGTELAIDCIRGIVNFSLENTQEGDRAYPFCQTLKDETLRQFCFQWTGWYAFTELSFTPEQVLKDCEKYSAGKEPGCTLAQEAAKP